MGAMGSVSDAADKGGCFNEEGLRSNVHPGVDLAIAELGVRQHAVVGFLQLCEPGLGARAIQLRAATGRLHRLYQAVYSLVPRELLTRDGAFMAAVLACGPDAAISYRSAAALHELRRTERSRIDVTIPQRSPRKHPGIDIHRSITLAPADVTTIRNIPCTTVARTLLDLGQVVNRREVARACDQAEILDAFDLGQLLDQIDRNLPRLAAKRLRAVLDEHYIGSTPTWSELEEEFVALCRDAGLPLPEVNVWITPDDEEPWSIRADFVWREQRLIVQTDGRGTHRTAQAFEHDRREDQRLIAAGWTVIRTTWRQVTRRPREVARTISRLLRG
jgi:predicted transcriptional regulator of viral defense system